MTPLQETLRTSREDLKALGDASALLTALDSLEQRVAAIPRGEFDVAARAEELGPDVPRLFAFVRDQVRFEGYSGVLRGARGTLMGQAGNAYDKSLLLGALLVHHGIEVRYVHGRLASDQASALVAQMFASARLSLPRAATSPADAPPRVASGSRAIAAIATARWFSALAVVRTTLARDKVALSAVPAKTAADLAAEAADHVWVEYRSGTAWIALDPSVKDASPGQTFAAAEERWSEIPSTQHHRVAIRIVLEERGAGGLKTNELLRHEATAAELHGAVVTFAHETDGPALAGTMTPVLRVDNSVYRGEKIGVTGLPGGIPGLGGRLFATPGSGSAAEGGLSAEWIVFNFTSPSGRVETVRREVFDRIGPGARAEGREADAALTPLPEGSPIPPGLATIFSFSFRSGRLHPALPLTQIVGDIAPLRRAMEAASALRRLGRDPTDQEQKDLAAAAAPMLPEMLSTLAASFYRWSQKGVTLVRPPGVLFYEATPRLVIAAASSDLGTTPGSGSLSLDLRRNEMRAVAEQDVPGRRVVWASTLRGILDGILEDVLVSEVLGASAQSGVAPAAGAATIIERARTTGVSFTAATSKEAIRLLNVPEAARARMLESLSEEVALVTPTRPVALGGADRLAWWRLDLRSGETLAVSDAGLHFTVLELTVSVGIITALAVAAIPLYYVLIEWVHRRAVEDAPWCAGIAAVIACSNMGEPPPGCYPYNAPDGGVNWTCE